MKWTNERGGNVDDRRGKGGKVAGGLGVGTIVIAAIIYFMGGNPMEFLSQSQVTSPAQVEERALTPEEEHTGELIKMLDAWMTTTWTDIFQENGATYQPPTIVIFNEGTQSACGPAQRSMGPFYCPADQGIYVDMAFFTETLSRFGAETTEFVVAYVLAHETGHHVQNLTGVLDQQHQLRTSGRYSTAQLNQISVAVELQADFYAGVWAKRNNQRVPGGVLEPGDIESAVTAAAAVGDDNIQKRTQGHVNQETFTHGSSKQRIEWFLKGYETGDIKQGNTFDALLN